MRRTPTALERSLAVLGLACWRFDVVRSELDCDEAQLEQLIGYRPTDGQDLSSLWVNRAHPEDREWLASYRELMVANPATTGYECDYRTILPDGGERWLRESVQIERDAQRRAVMLVGLLMNISDRREMDERRAESAARFRAAFEDAATGIAMVGLDGRFIEVNRQFAAVAGVSIESLVGTQLADLAHPEDDASLRAAPTADGTALQRRERRYRRHDGEIRWVVETASVIRDAEAIPSYFIVQVLDETERRNAESSLKTTEAQLLQAQKMEALGLLAGGVAHDFNNLLTVIKSYSQMVLETVEASDPIHEDLTEVVGAADRAAALTRQLLAFSRKQAHHWQTLRLDRIVTETERMLRRLLGSSAELVVDVSPGIGDIEADKGQLEQVIMNLVVNARDAMPSGGRITIAATDLVLADAMNDSIPSTVPAGEYVVLEVADTGLGMDAATISRIFEPFFTTKAAGHGTGLGLSTVYGIVQQCGGFLVVTSIVGEGTRFRIFFPRRQEKAAAPIDAAGSRQLQGGTETVLVVEDDDAVRTLTKQVLVRLGYSVLTARDAPEAIRIAAAFDTTIHLLLCDVHLPGASGYVAADSILQGGREASVLFMSGHTDLVDDGGVPSMNMAALRRMELLAKPFSPAQVALAVRSSLDASMMANSRFSHTTT